MTVGAATAAVAANTKLQIGLAALKAQLEAQQAVVALVTRALEQGPQARAGTAKGRHLDIFV